MATIIERKLKDGTKHYRATVRVMRGSTMLHCETQTFHSRKLARAWSDQREIELKGTDRAAISTRREPRLASKESHQSKSSSDAFLRSLATRNSLNGLGISASDELIYRALLVFGKDTARNVAERLGASLRSVMRSMEALLKEGLIHQNDGSPRAYYASPPELAIEHLLNQRATSARAAIIELNIIVSAKYEFKAAEPDA